MSARLYEHEPRLLLRTGEIETLRRFDAEGQDEAAKTMRKLGTLRYGLTVDRRERAEVDWLRAYQEACVALEILLAAPVRLQEAQEARHSAEQRMREEIARRKEEGWRMHVAETAAERLEEENERLRAERDDALSRAADSFAMGRRSAA